SPPLQSYAPIVVQQLPPFQPDIGLAIPTCLPTDDPIASLNKAMIFLSYAGNAGNNQASGTWVINVVGNTRENQPRNFLADSLEEIDDCEDLQIQATVNFKANHLDAYDSDCDDEATANAIFMANLSLIGSLNADTVEPCYDSGILSEVPHYDTYHDSDMVNSNIQELGYIENIVS
ncbi:hypothetical protein Tco_1232857, partial [Tanacetum coccineum]